MGIDRDKARGALRHFHTEVADGYGGVSRGGDLVVLQLNVEGKRCRFPDAVDFEVSTRAWLAAPLGRSPGISCGYGWNTPASTPMPRVLLSRSDVLNPGSSSTLTNVPISTATQPVTIRVAPPSAATSNQPLTRSVRATASCGEGSSSNFSRARYPTTEPA